MRWRREEPTPKRRPAGPTGGRQVWLRNPDPTDAIFGRFPQTLDLGNDPDKVKVYPDEIDPEWAEPATFDAATDSSGQHPKGTRPE